MGCPVGHVLSNHAHPGEGAGGAGLGSAEDSGVEWELRCLWVVYDKFWGSGLLSHVSDEWSCFLGQPSLRLGLGLPQPPRAPSGVTWLQHIYLYSDKLFYFELNLYSHLSMHPGDDPRPSSLDHQLGGHFLPLVLVGCPPVVKGLSNS